MPSPSHTIPLAFSAKRDIENPHGVPRLVVLVDSDILDTVHHIEARGTASEHGMLAVEPLCWDRGDEELGAWCA